MNCSSSFCFAGFTFLLLLLATLFITILYKRRSTIRRPQGPPAWPLVGNIFDLGTNPHQSLHKLGFKYGDLLRLRLGWTNTLVIQTAKAAEELFKNHDTSFCDRKAPESWTAHNYVQSSIAMGRYGPSWRILRKIVTIHLMATKHIQETVLLRQKCIDDMIRFVEEDSAAAQGQGESGEIELSRYIFVMAFNLVGNLVLSKDLVDSKSEQGNEFFHALDKVLELRGKPNLADFFPILKRFDPQRIKSNMKRHLGRALGIVEKLVMERIEDRKLMKQRDHHIKDFLDAFLEHDESISNHNMLIIILEMFFGSTDTITSSTEWVMTELLHSPESMRKVKEELTNVVGLERKVNERDIDQLEYLQAVIKETMRLHPVLALIPRNTLRDTNFMGYFIEKDTQVFVNAWAIGRDPDAWEDTLSFKPGRFLGSKIQYRGHNYELIPFGAGRRICVGFPLAHQMLHLTVASLIQRFDWELDTKSAAEALDMNERFGMAVRKLIHLRAIPKKRMASTL